jgi:uncharacterized delta-60 repeat protein
MTLSRLDQDGALDDTFSGNGMLVTNLGLEDFDWPVAIALQPDGRIVVAATGGPTFSQKGFILARFNADGSPDSGFGNGGVVTTATERESLTDLALTPDGRIIVAGYRPGKDGTDPAGDDVALARYGANGQLDESFAGDGLTTIDLGGSESADSVAIQSDGRIVVAGLYQPAGVPAPSTSYDFMVARFHQDGAPDASFAQGGLAVTDLGAAESARALAIDELGRIVVGGESTITAPLDSSDERYGVARYLPSGSLDPAFSGDGVVVGRFGNGGWSSRASDVALTAEGGLALVGTSSPQNELREQDTFLSVTRFDADGQPKTAFGDSGSVVSRFAPDLTGMNALVMPRGRIYAVGHFYRGRLAVARYLDEHGPRDADADGFIDRDDRCPKRFGRRHGGCPLNWQDVWFRYSDLFSSLRGRLVSDEIACIRNRRVVVFRKLPGPDRKLASRTSSHEDGHFQVKFAPKGHGRFYAVTPRIRRPGFGICPGDRSDVVSR